MHKLIEPIEAGRFRWWLVSHRVALRAILIVGPPVALWLLQPWKLLIRTTADDRLPPGTQTTYCGEFIGHVHRTSGVARLITLSDGAQMLRLENLRTTLGPRLRVWLSDTPVEHASFPWRNFEHSNHIDLGPLRANRGDADYAVPGGADTKALSSVILWCERFSVSFGAAQLHPLIQSASESRMAGPGQPRRRSGRGLSIITRVNRAEGR